ncbi:MAG: 3'-5' exonuclease [Bacteroidetes bacterium]|nr:3'-5' exonuclease [Bacteroidota bacterium]
MSQLSLNRPIVFFDLETTGTNPATDRIIELSLVKILPEGRRDTWTQRLNPGMPIPAESSAVHGIFDADVQDLQGFRQIAKELWAWMKNCDLGGYNVARFDLPLLVEEFLRSDVPVDFANCRVIDAQKIFFKMEQRTLSAAYQFYCGKTMENAHCAEADTLASIEVLEAQIDHYPELGHEVEGLYEFLKEEEPFVDYAQRLKRKSNGVVVFNFGKYIGKSVEEIFTKEPSYYDWMMKADFSLHTKQKISEIINQMKLGKLRQA